MNTVYLLLGSNMGDKAALLEKAAALIHRLAGKIIHCSSLYESEPWGFETDEWFLNQVLCINTLLSPEQLLHVTQEIERTLGRVGKPESATSQKPYQSRPIDIDLLFYNERIINTPTLTIPHLLLQQRLFTLLPLAEIAADFVHPIFKKSIALLLQECPDKSTVRKYA